MSFRNYTPCWRSCSSARGREHVDRAARQVGHQSGVTPSAACFSPLSGGAAVYALSSDVCALRCQFVSQGMFITTEI